VQIFATDIDSEALETARLGRYPEGISRFISPERLERFFVRDGAFYRVVTDIREMCVFSLHNLIRDVPFSRLDLISCRNLLIYLDATLQARIFPLFHFALRHGGFLFLGPSENISQHEHLFGRIDVRLRLFKARPVKVERPAIGFPLGIASYRTDPPSDKAAGSTAPEDTLARRAVSLVEPFNPAYVVIDDHHDVIHFSGRTGRYLQPSPGAANLNLFKILDPGLRSDVRVALHRAAANGEAVRQEGIFHKVGGDTHLLNVFVEPLTVMEGAHHYVVIFQDLGPVKTREAGEAGSRSDAERDDTIAHLESELLATRERLQSTIEELETSNEEMKASNEEFQSVNEELQSSNEELETSKEELQSVNEELETVNSELSSKVDSLERANNDRKNLLESTQIATLFLDGNLCIKSFTPAFTDMFHLIEADAGRPITDIVSRLAYDRLETDVRRVLHTLNRVEQEVKLADGSATYMMRILPYRTVGNLIDGVVITFIDITERKRAEEDRVRLAAIVETSNDAIMGLSVDGAITIWNQGAERLYGYTGKEAVGQPFTMLLPEENKAELHTILERMKRSKVVSPIETTRRCKDGRIIHVASTVSPLRNPADTLIAGSVSERDITERKRAEERQRILVAELNHRVKNTLAAVVSISANTLSNSASLEDFRHSFEGRIHALAKARDLLSASSWSGADMGSLVEAELVPYADGERIKIRGEKITLSSSAALSFAMIVHELATNAAKYGALSREIGRLEVSWSNSDADQRFVLDWVESGGPALGGPPLRRGFGLGLIERSVTRDLQGTPSIDFARTGLRVRIDVPLGEIKARNDI